MRPLSHPKGANDGKIQLDGAALRRGPVCRDHGPVRPGVAQVDQRGSDRGRAGRYDHRALPQRRHAYSFAAGLIRAALHPRKLCIGLAFWAVLHLIDRVIAGVVQCSALGCLPNGGAL